MIPFVTFCQQEERTLTVYIQKDNLTCRKWLFGSLLFSQRHSVILTDLATPMCQHWYWPMGTVARVTNTSSVWLWQPKKNTLSSVSPTIITASLPGYYSPTLTHLHWLPGIIVGVFIIFFLMLFSSTYFIPQVAKTTSLYLGQAIIRADGLFDFHLDNTLRMLSESVNTSQLLVWLLSFDSFVLVAFWKNRLL